MSMNIGRMDRLIEIQYPVRTRNELGEETDVWTRLRKVWAQATPLTANERYKSDAQRESKTYVFKMRYVTGVGPEMRVVHDAQNYRITGIAEIGRREGLEITAEYLQKSGKGN